MKVVVVGGGIVGLSSAYFLAERGAEVVVLEARDSVGAVTSFANGGLLTPSMAWPWNMPGLARQVIRWLGKEDAPLLLRPRALPGLWRWGTRFLRESNATRYWRNTEKNARLALDNLRKLREIREATGMDFTHAANGTLEVHRDPGRLHEAGAKADRLRALGIRSQTLDRSALLWNEPALEPVARELAGAIRFPDDETGDARQYCEALAAFLVRQSVDLKLNSSVRRVTTSGRRVDGVVCEHGDIKADAVIVAAGTATPELMRPAGRWIPIAPVKGYSITIDASRWRTRPSLPVADDELHATATPLGTRIRVAGTAELAGFSNELTTSRVANVLGLLQRIYPGETANLTQEQVQPWTGLRPMSADGVPLIGTSPVEGLYVNSGHGHLGWTMGVASGHLVAELLTGGEPAVRAGDYAPSRFWG